MPGFGGHAKGPADFAVKGRSIQIDPAAGTGYRVYDIDARTVEDRTSDSSQIPL